MIATLVRAAAVAACAIQRCGHALACLDALPSGWVRYVDDDTGTPYYHEEASGTTTWERPAHGEWTELWSDDGEPYYHNEATGVTTWDRPAQQLSPTPPTAETSCVWLSSEAESSFGASPPEAESSFGASPPEAESSSGESPPIGDSIQRGEVVVCVPRIADDDELDALLAAGVAASDAQRERAGRAPTSGRYRFSVSDDQAFETDTVLRCEEVLLRVLDHVDEHMPSVYESLFRPDDEWASRQPLTAKGVPVEGRPLELLGETCPSLRELYMSGELEWSEGEPAINVYAGGGAFGNHKDHMALTVLIPLTSAGGFSGGGTGFWSAADEAAILPGVREVPPTTVITPERGTALLFGGDVLHAGMPIESGLRSVFVASFSTRTPASPDDRVHGMQSAPASSALREYSTDRG